MASSSMLLSSSLTLPHPPSRALPTPPAAAAAAAGSGPARLFASSRGGVVASVGGCVPGMQLGFSPRRRGRVVVCEVAVEFGGSQRSSEGEEPTRKKVEAGTRIRVLGPLKVYHVPKIPELDINGFEGQLKEVVTTFKGRPVSATFPFKVQLMTPGEGGRKFFVHLKEDEFEVLE